MMRAPAPLGEEATRDTLELILDLIHEETKRPRPSSSIGLQAKLVKLTFLFNELEKHGK